MSLPGVSGLLVAEKRRWRGLIYICSALAQAVPHPKTIFLNKNGIPRLYIRNLGLHPAQVTYTVQWVRVLPEQLSTVAKPRRPSR
jgi:hypothetical protein